MPHIVHLEAGRHLYGGARQVLLLTAGLVSQGCESTIVCPPHSAVSNAAHPSVQVHAMPMAGDLDAGFAYRFSKWLEQEQPDLVHVHSRRGADLWGGLGAKWAGIPAVVTRRVDNPESSFLGPLKYRRYQRVIAISQGVVDQLKATGVPAADIRLVHSAVTPADEQAAWSDDQFRKTFNLNEQDIVVVCAAQFIPRKGHDVLLEAWSEVISACPTARLLLLGRGPEEERLRNKVKASVSGSSVQFAGFRDDLRQFLGRADVLVHPAVREGLGIAVLEAQAAGVPVVAARAGGLPEAVAEGVSGVLVEPQDAGQLAHALIRVLRDPQLRREFGAAGREHVATSFGPVAMVAGNLAVYREVLEMQSA